MSRRANGHLRCRTCLLYETLCVCPIVPRIETRTRLVLVIHRLEARKPTNTGRLGAACFPNSETIVRGEIDRPSETFVAPAGTQPVLLFPHEDARPLADLVREGMFDERPATLIVPDGTWRQARKVRDRVPGLAAVPCATLEPEQNAPSKYRLRKDAHAHGLATIEAIARAMGLLEGAAVRAALDQLLDVMVERTLWLRGAGKDGGFEERLRLALALGSISRGQRPSSI